jgi:hypothetical protein
MNMIIDLGSELLVDASEIRDPYVRLLTAAFGQRLADGSPWVAVPKRTARLSVVSRRRSRPRKHRARSSRAPRR